MRLVTSLILPYMPCPLLKVFVQVAISIKRQVNNYLYIIGQLYDFVSRLARLRQVWWASPMHLFSYHQLKKHFCFLFMWDFSISCRFLLSNNAMYLFYFIVHTISFTMHDCFLKYFIFSNMLKILIFSQRTKWHFYLIIWAV